MAVTREICRDVGCCAAAAAVSALGRWVYTTVNMPILGTF